MGLSTGELSQRVRAYYRKLAVKKDSVKEHDEWSERIQASLNDLETQKVDTAFVRHVLAVGRDLVGGYDELFHRREMRTRLFPERTPRAEAAILRAVRTLLGLGWPRIRQVFGRKLREEAWGFYAMLEYFEARLNEVGIATSDTEDPVFWRRHALDWKPELTGCIVCLMEALEGVPKRERWIAELLEFSQLLRGQELRGEGDRSAFVKKRYERARTRPASLIPVVARFLRSSYEELRAEVVGKR